MSDSTSYTVDMRVWDVTKTEALATSIGDMLGVAYKESSGADMSWYSSKAGDVGDVARAIREIDPTAIFQVWEDPAYEYMGTLVISVPGHDLFHADCDSDGSVYLSYDALCAELDSGKTVAQAYGEDLLALMPGKTHDAPTSTTL